MLLVEMLMQVVCYAHAQAKWLDFTFNLTVFVLPIFNKTANIYYLLCAGPYSKQL